MDDISRRLHEYFNGSATRLLARVAPLTLLAGSIGTTLAAIIARPEFATTGWGIVLGGIAINLTSSLVYEAISAPSDDERIAFIKEGLTEQDYDVMILAAATLITAGPEMARALPNTGRTELVAALEQGMRQAGGPLSAISSRYAAALYEDQTDWLTVQKDLHQTLNAIQQLMEVGEDGVISDSHMRVEGIATSIVQSMRATGRARIENSSQTTIDKANAHETHD